jgi:hypothetical protein
MLFLWFSPMTSPRMLTLVVHSHTHTQMSSSFKAPAKRLYEFHLHQFLLLVYYKGVFPCLTSTHSIKLCSKWLNISQHLGGVLRDHVSHEHNYSLIIGFSIHGEHLCCVLLKFFTTSDYQLNEFCSPNLLFFWIEIIMYLLSKVMKWQRIWMSFRNKLKCLRVVCMKYLHMVMNTYLDGIFYLKPLKGANEVIGANYTVTTPFLSHYRFFSSN